MAPQNPDPLFFFILLLPFTSSLSFNFSSFSQNTLNSIEFQGDAFLNQVIQLTKNELGVNITQSTGRVLYREPLLLWDSNTGVVTDFTTHFSFIINAFDNPIYGDGLTFFLAPYPSLLPSNSSGGNLGLFSENSSYQANNSFVAVEFDTFQNEWDASTDHVGIDVNSIKSVAAIKWSTSMKDGRIGNAWISYKASSKNLSVFLTYENSPAFRGNWSLSTVVDLREKLPDKVAIGFSASTGHATEIHNLLSWEFDSNLAVKKKKKIGKVMGVVVSIGVTMFALGLVWFILRRRKPRKQAQNEEFEYDASLDNEFEKGRGPKRFSFTQLVEATKNFAKELKLGEGGFGEVYKGVLNDSKLEVAIKRVSAGSKQGKKEYMAEVKIISQLRHRNLVQLIGWCHGQGEFLLVYEFMPNGSLDSHIYNKNHFLAWPLRYKIVLGLASSLLYLHEEWEQCVVHRDIKPSNVMLDSMFNAKLGDFGLARLVNHEIGSQTTVLAGTMGYLAPEIVTTGRASKESDVYSFGVVALEIACGRRPVDPKESLGKVKLVEYVWDLYGKRMMLEAADTRLKMDFEEKEMERLMIVGLWCAHPDHNLRPSIRQAINVLKFEAPLPELPSKMPVPVFYAPPIDITKFGFMSSTGVLSSLDSVSTGYTSNSSRLTMSSNSSSSACLLKSHKTEL
ncbi:uncharacterized protein A4U43_C03F10840 [Asparagus officinalis]|uniref:non-specific serine/threonine protein kinase n=1 Tax=Asparagus officinalis TaxID=4686 RepID=A0A5P1FBR6_ASPOF|nr:L-type lectin-domain containing receptor kinase IX.1-like [Asparagus officinalis]ONK74857.1 uncharacterized protein A4U43_C03F10840 [Asparagus officinalis]